MKKNLSIKIKHLAIMVPVLLTLLSACDKRMRPHVHEHFNVAREDGKIIVKSSSKGHVTSIFITKTVNITIPPTRLCFSQRKRTRQ